MRRGGAQSSVCLSTAGNAQTSPTATLRLHLPPYYILNFPTFFFPTSEFPLGIRLLSFLYLFSCLCLPSFILISVFPPLLPSSPDALGFHPSLLSPCESYFTARLIVKEKNENARRCGTESGREVMVGLFLTVMELRCGGRIIQIMEGPMQKVSNGPLNRRARDGGLALRRTGAYETGVVVGRWGFQSSSLC